MLRLLVALLLSLLVLCADANSNRTIYYNDASSIQYSSSGTIPGAIFSCQVFQNLSSPDDNLSDNNIELNCLKATITFNFTGIAVYYFADTFPSSGSNFAVSVDGTRNSTGAFPAVSTDSEESVALKAAVTDLPNSQHQMLLSADNSLFDPQAASTNNDYTSYLSLSYFVITVVDDTTQPTSSSPTPSPTPNTSSSSDHSKTIAIAASVSSVGTLAIAIVTIRLLRRRKKRKGSMLDLDRKVDYENHHLSKGHDERENGKQDAAFGPYSKTDDEETKAGTSQFAPSNSAKITVDQHPISDSHSEQPADKPESSNAAHPPSTSTNIHEDPSYHHQTEIETPPLSPSSRLDPLVQSELDRLQREIRNLQAQVQSTSHEMPPPRYE